MVGDGPGDPILDQKYDPFLEAIEVGNSDFRGAEAGLGWLGLAGLGWLGWSVIFPPFVLYCCENNYNIKLDKMNIY